MPDDTQNRALFSQMGRNVYHNVYVLQLCMCQWFVRTLDSNKVLNCVLYFTLHLQFLFYWHNIPICVCVHVSGSVRVCRKPTTPKLKTSDFGVISPLRASGAMYARVPTILSVIMVVDVRLADALVSPKSEIFATKFSSNRIFALTGKKI